VFQGNHWLYQLDTPLGGVLVIRQNDGGLRPDEGEAVHLCWRAQDMRAVP
jgi:putative spermidine/putrescine transport system ATP-binding protein